MTSGFNWVEVIKFLINSADDFDDYIKQVTFPEPDGLG